MNEVFLPAIIVCYTFIFVNTIFNFSISKYTREKI